MNGHILTCNAGSGSFKSALFCADSLELLCRLSADYHEDPSVLRITNAQGEEKNRIPLNEANSRASVEAVLDWVGKQKDIGIKAVGHRVVHGGERLTRPVRLNDEVLEEMKKLNPLAPLHQPHNITPITHICNFMPDLPQIVCFDTSFHATQSQEAKTYALPRELREKGIRRYGFHGLSYEYIASCLDLLPEKNRDRVIVAHLGSGCSACALKDGKSFATTMGLTALEGLMMRTRCGDLDPGAVLYLLREEGYAPQELEKLLYLESGLKGMAGGAGDMREILNTKEKDEKARMAFELFCFMAAREIGGLAAVLGGMQALIFTGKVGKLAHKTRARICEYFTWMGLRLDESANEQNEETICANGSSVIVRAMETNEALMIARHTKRLTQGKEFPNGKERSAA
jgi:acetate kinase